MNPKIPNILTPDNVYNLQCFFSFWGFASRLPPGAPDSGLRTPPGDFRPSDLLQNWTPLAPKTQRRPCQTLIFFCNLFIPAGRPGMWYAVIIAKIFATVFEIF